MAGEWRRRAACLGVDPELFYPSKGFDGAAAARRVCVSCPVRVECLDYALAIRDQHGVFGGMTARERIPLHGPYRPPCGTRRGYQWHREHGEDPCEDCRDASRAYYRVNERARRVAS